MKSRNWMRVVDAADDSMLSGAASVTDVAVACVDRDAAVFPLFCFFLLGLMVCRQSRWTYVTRRHNFQVLSPKSYILYIVENLRKLNAWCQMPRNAI